MVQTLTQALKLYFETQPAPLMDFVNAFFPDTRIFESAEIPVDRLMPSNKLAGYRPLGMPSSVMAYNAGTGASYTAPVISVKTPVDEDLAAGVTVGMEPNAPVGAQLLRKYANIQNQHANAIYHQITKQAADVLLYGRFDLLDALGNKIGAPINFNRDPSLFDDTHDYSSDPVGQISAALQLLRPFNFPKVGVFALVGETVWARLTQDTKFINLLKGQGVNAGRTWIQPDNRVVAQVYFGILANIPVPMTICVMSDAYTDAAGETNPYIPDKAVVVGSFTSARIQAYGGIFITDVPTTSGQVQTGQIITDRLISKDPDVLAIRSQSRPLLIPGEVNHTACVVSSV